jgi:hypothetical protein
MTLSSSFGGGRVSNELRWYVRPRSAVLASPKLESRNSAFRSSATHAKPDLSRARQLKRSTGEATYTAYAQGFCPTSAPISNSSLSRCSLTHSCWARSSQTTLISRSHTRSYPTTISRSCFSTSAATMAAVKIDGTAIAKKIRERLHTEIQEKQAANPRFQPCLKIIQGKKSCCGTNKSCSSLLTVSSG